MSATAVGILIFTAYSFCVVCIFSVCVCVFIFFLAPCVVNERQNLLVATRLWLILLRHLKLTKPASLLQLFQCALRDAVHRENRAGFRICGLFRRLSSGILGIKTYVVNSSSRCCRLWTIFTVIMWQFPSSSAEKKKINERILQISELWASLTQGCLQCPSFSVYPLVCVKLLANCASVCVWVCVHLGIGAPG